MREALVKTAKDEFDSVAILPDFSPLLDPELCREAEHDHFQHLSHYTYSENVPPGFLPDFASLEFVQLHGEKGPDDLRAFLVKKMDEYDVEIFHKRPDLRQFRVDLTCASARSRRLAAEILAAKPGLRYGELQAFLLENPQILRPYPSYFEIELSSHSPVKPIFLPATDKEAGHMQSDLLDKLEADIRENGMRGDATISFAGPGEPLEHPELQALLARFSALENVGRIYLETYGAKCTPEFVESLQVLECAEKIHLIFRLTTLKADRYRKLYGADLLATVLENIARIERLPVGTRRFSVHAEMLKIKDVEDEISAYYDRFEDSPFEVILQKFNRYIDLVPERRVSDLTPIHRDFCWHLARDFYLTVDALVPLCKQDPFAKRGPFCDFRKLTVKEIGNSTQVHHNASVRGQSDRIPMPCLSCDEWYTFNG